MVSIIFLQTVTELETKLNSTLCTSIREGLASIRIAEFLNRKLISLGKNAKGTPSAVLWINTGAQTTLAGVGEMFEELKTTGKILKKVPFDEEPTELYDRKYYHTSEYRLMKFDETFYQMPYDCRTRKNALIIGESY